MIYFDKYGDQLLFCLENKINIIALEKQVTVSHGLFDMHEKYDRHGGDRIKAVNSAIVKLVDQINKARDPGRDPKVGVFKMVAPHGN